MVTFYLVGGAVRDRLLGLDPAERDWVAVGATPEELESQGFRRLDAGFPVFTHPETGEEYALARRERKTGEGHKGFVVESGPDVTLEEDLKRRDLRINAMAQPESGELIDPFCGRADLESRILRHVSPAFVEDPLRVLRAARFAARFAHLGFSIHAETSALMAAMAASGDMGTLSGGRVWRETDAALAAASPAVYFRALETCGALARVLPEFTPSREAAPGVLAPLEAAAALDARAEVRFAALAAGFAAGGDLSPLDRLCARLPVPKRYADLARLALTLRLEPAAGGAPSLLEALENADAFRRGGRFGDALEVLEAVEPEDGDRSGSVRARLELAYSAARRVDGAGIAASGLKGEQVARELRRRRLAAIEEALAGKC